MEGVLVKHDRVTTILSRGFARRMVSIHKSTGDDVARLLGSHHSPKRSGSGFPPTRTRRLAATFSSEAAPSSRKPAQ